MKTKLILSAVVAASIALSSSVFAADDVKSPSGRQLVQLFKKYCVDDVKGKTLADMLSESAEVSVNPTQATRICQAIRDHSDD